LSSTSPTPLGGANGPGSCRGADAVDSPVRVFTSSSKFDRLYHHIDGVAGPQRHCHSNGVANSTWVAKLFYRRYWGYIGCFNSSAVACDISII